MLSVCEDPKSLAAVRSNPGAAGAVLSTCNVIAGDVVVFPARSIWRAVISRVPSDRLFKGRLQAPPPAVDPTSTPFERSRNNCPLVEFDPSIVRFLFEVMLSVSEIPESCATEIFGCAIAAGGVVSIVKANGVVAELTLPETSDAVAVIWWTPSAS